MDNHSKALLKLNLATLMLSGNTTLAKLISLPSDLIILLRSIIAAIALFCFLVGFKDSLKFTKKRDYFWALFLGLLMGLHWYCLFQSAKVSTVAVALIAFFTYPMITIFLEPIFNKGRIAFQDGVFALLVFGGVILIVPEFNLANNITQGILLGLISALAFSFRIIFTRKYLQQYSGLTVMFYQLIGVIFLFLPITWGENLEFQGNDIVYLLFLGILFTAVTHSLLLDCLRYLKAKTLGFIGSMQPIYGAFWGFLFLNEIPSIRTLIGGALILVVVIAENFRAKTVIEG